MKALWEVNQKIEIMKSNPLLKNETTQKSKKKNVQDIKSKSVSKSIEKIYP